MDLSWLAWETEFGGFMDRKELKRLVDSLAETVLRPRILGHLLTFNVEIQEAQEFRSASQFATLRPGVAWSCRSQATLMVYAWCRLLPHRPSRDDLVLHLSVVRRLLGEPTARQDRLRYIIKRAFEQLGADVPVEEVKTLRTGKRATEFEFLLRHRLDRYSPPDRLYWFADLALAGGMCAEDALGLFRQAFRGQIRRNWDEQFRTFVYDLAGELGTLPPAADSDLL